MKSLFNFEIFYTFKTGVAVYIFELINQFNKKENMRNRVICRLFKFINLFSSVIRILMIFVSESLGKHKFLFKYVFFSFDICHIRL